MASSRPKSKRGMTTRVKDDTLDLSYCELDEVPVREIARIPRARTLNLSSNNLTSLPITFTTLLQVVVLDLSKNRLTELPENIGIMTQLKRLDLYCNQISRLPLSLGELKNLRWLDLKENPLTEAVALVAGPCNNAEQCQQCARNIVNYLSTAKTVIEEERLRRLNNLPDDATCETFISNETESQSTTGRKEGKKKKKKNVEKKCKTDDNRTESLIQSDSSVSPMQHSDSDADVKTLRNALSKASAGTSAPDADTNESHRPKKSCCLLTRLLAKSFLLIVGIIVASFVVSFILFFTSLHYDLWSNMSLTDSSLRNYHAHTKDMLESIMNITWVQINSIADVINDYIRMYFKSDA